MHASTPVEPESAVMDGPHAPAETVGRCAAHPATARGTISMPSGGIGERHQHAASVAARGSSAECYVLKRRPGISSIKSESCWLNRRPLSCQENVNLCYLSEDQPLW